MSLDIDQIALYQLVKRDEQTLELVLRDSLLDATPAVDEMNKAYGVFEEQSELAQALRGCRKGERISQV